jgi:hypothetical protein
VHWDAGQFLHQDGRITALYDFETCLVGDPMMDLAALRMRDPAEPVGADLAHLFRHYASVSGEPVDVETLRFHTVVFALVGVMALAGPLVEPLPGSPHLEYLWWDLMQRRTLVWALAECLGLEIRLPDPVEPRPSPVGPVLRMLEDTLDQLPPGTGYERYQRQSAVLLARCATHADSVRPQLDAQTVEEVARLLGTSLADLPTAQRELEAFVLQAGPQHDAALVALLARQVERAVLALEPVADRVAGYALEPVVL